MDYSLLICIEKKRSDSVSIKAARFSINPILESSQNLQVTSNRKTTNLDALTTALTLTNFQFA